MLILCCFLVFVFTHSHLLYILYPNIQQYRLKSDSQSQRSPQSLKQEVLIQCNLILSDLSKKTPTGPLKTGRGRFKCKQREYQETGIKWLGELHKLKINSILADDVGLGKTVQIIGLFVWLSVHHQINGSHLVITPKSQLSQWHSQFKSYYPGCKVLVFDEMESKDLHKKYAARFQWTVCMVSYDTFLRYSLQFRSMEWQYVVMDQAAQIDDLSNSKWSSLFRLRCKQRVLLLDETMATLHAKGRLWSILYALNPGAFSSKSQFVEWFDTIIGSYEKLSKSSSLNVNEFNDDEHERDLNRKLEYVLGPFMLRRCRYKRDGEKEQVIDEQELPRPIEKRVLCQLTPRQQRLYDEKCATLKSVGGMDYDEKLAVIYALQQICNHPNLGRDSKNVPGTDCNTYSNTDSNMDSNTDSNHLHGLDPLAQIEMLCHSKHIANGLRIERPKMGDDNVDSGHTLRLQRLYQPLFDKLRHDVSDIEKKESASEMNTDDDEEEDESTEESSDDATKIMSKGSVPSDDLIEVLSNPLRAILEENEKYHREKRESMRVKIENEDTGQIAKQQQNQNKEKSASQDPEDEDVPTLNVGVFCKLWSSFSAKGLAQWDASKLNALQEILEDLHGERRHKILLFASSARMMDLLEFFVVILQYEYLRMDHRMDREMATKCMHKFNDDRDKTFIFIISTRSMHISSCNLIKADTIIFYENEWNSMVNDNVNRCLAKINGHHQTTIYRLINQNTIEERMGLLSQQNLTPNESASSLPFSVAAVLTKVDPLHILKNCMKSEKAKEDRDIESVINGDASESKMSVDSDEVNDSETRSCSAPSHMTRSQYAFNMLVTKMEHELKRKSIDAFHRQIELYRSEFAEHRDIESVQYMDSVENRMNNKTDKLAAKLLKSGCFREYIDPQRIERYYHSVGFQLKLQLHRYSYWLKYNVDLNASDDTECKILSQRSSTLSNGSNIGMNTRMRPRLVFKSGDNKVSCVRGSNVKSYIDFKSAAARKSGDRSISKLNLSQSSLTAVHEVKEKENDKNNKMEMDEDEDSDLAVSPKALSKGTEGDGITSSKSNLNSNAQILRTPRLIKRESSLSSTSRRRQTLRINASEIPSKASAGYRGKRRNKMEYRISREKRDTLHLYDDDGDYYQHPFEQYNPFGIVYNDSKVDPAMKVAVERSIQENGNNPLRWNAHLEYDYNQVLSDEPDEDAKDKERDSMYNVDGNGVTGSIVDDMSSLFKQWQEANNKMYRQNGIIPGYRDRRGNIAPCLVDVESGEIDYGTLDQFVRNLGDDHVLRLYLREKANPKSITSISTGGTQLNGIKVKSEEIQVEKDNKSKITNNKSEKSSHSTSSTPPTPNGTPSKPKRFKLKLSTNSNSKKIPLITEDVNMDSPLDEHYESDYGLGGLPDWGYCSDDNNVMARFEDDDYILHSPDCPLPVKVYDDDNAMSAFDFQVFKIQEEWKKTGSLKASIDEFKFTPKPPTLMYTEPSPSPEQVDANGDGDPYTSVEDHDTTDTEEDDPEHHQRASDSVSTTSSSLECEREGVYREESSMSSSQIPLMSLVARQDMLSLQQKQKSKRHRKHSRNRKRRKREKRKSRKFRNRKVRKYDDYHIIHILRHCIDFRDFRILRKHKKHKNNAKNENKRNLEYDLNSTLTL